MAVAVAGTVAGTRPAVVVAVADMAAVPVLLRTPIVPLAVAMAIAVTIVAPNMTAVAAVVTVAMRNLHGSHGFFLDVRVYEVAHVVCADVDKFLHLDAPLHRANDLCILVDLADPVLRGDRLVCGDEVQLVQNDLIGKRDLLVRLVNLTLLDLIVQTSGQVLGVSHGDHCIQPQVPGHLRVRHESPDDWHRVCHASCLNHDVVYLPATFDVI
mmetsp:Transcript_45264/g.137230  ORF Transcript_45264/g.137230 Transcript_45264/m.137230 type:complete len:212 (+) Transcript_45264:214-849(+)